MRKLERLFKLNSTFSTLVIFVFLLSPNLLEAEEEEAYRQVTFQSISWNKQILGLWFYNEAGDRVNTTPLPHIRGGEMSVKIKDNQLSFYNEQVDGSGQPKLVAQAVFPTETNKFLLLFNEKSENEYLIFVIPDDYESFPVGSFKVFNLTPFSIAYKLNEEAFSLKPLDAEVHSLKNSESAQVTSVRIALKAEEDEWQRGYSNRWSYNKNSRTIVFVKQRLGNTGNNLILVKRIREIIKP